MSEAARAIENREKAAASSAYGAYVLGILSLVGLFASLDRVMAGVLLQPIKDEMGVSDTAMGLLVGFTFTAFYVTLGVPIARWCDVGVRRSILGLGVAVWSAFTVLFGCAQGFMQLALCRVGVAVGEATAHPAAYSLIGDYYSRTQRARAISIFRASLSVGSIGGVIVAASLAQHYGWRAAFVSLGLPGLLLALTLRFTVKEPLRGANETASPSSTLTFKQALRTIMQDRALILMAFAMAFGTLTPLGAWIGPFLLRVHGFSLVEMGVSMGLVAGVGSLSGTLVGGLLWTALARRGVPDHWLPAFVAISYLLCMPCLLVVLLHFDMRIMLPAYFLLAFFLTVGAAPMLALVLNRVSPHARALTMSLFMMLITFADGGIGPIAVGILNDVFEPRFGAHAVRYSLLLCSGSFIFAAALMLLASRSLARSRSRNPSSSNGAGR